MRTKITLACTECKQRNYDTMKNKKNDPDRLEMNKYCRFCKKHTVHKETKQYKFLCLGYFIKRLGCEGYGKNKTTWK